MKKRPLGYRETDDTAEEATEIGKETVAGTSNRDTDADSGTQTKSSMQLNGQKTDREDAAAAQAV